MPRVMRATRGRQLLLPGLLALLLVPSAAHSAPDAQSSTIELEGHRFELRVTAREVTIRPAVPGQLLRYSMRRDGDFVHPAALDGGRLLGCVRSAGAASDYVFDVFPTRSEPLGWMLGAGAICGNTSSLLVRLVMPVESTKDPTYVETTFAAKERPETRRIGECIEVWSVRQWWGRGGTATSVLVPELRRVMNDRQVVLEPLDPDWTTWHPSVAGTSFGAAFVAGLEQENAPLMRRAIVEFYRRDSDALKAWSEAVGLPSTQEALLGLADAIDELVRAKARLADALRAQ